MRELKFRKSITRLEHQIAKKRKKRRRTR